MNLKSNINFTYTDGIGSVKQGIIEGFIIRSIKDYATKDRLVVFEYKVGNTIIKKDKFVATKEAAQVLYDAVKDTLPTIGDDLDAWDDSLFYEAFRVEMAKTFNKTVADIDVIPDEIPE